MSLKTHVLQVCLKPLSAGFAIVAVGSVTADALKAQQLNPFREKTISMLSKIRITIMHKLFYVDYTYPKSSAVDNKYATFTAPLHFYQ
jgi:hypothetical protein